MKENVDLEMKQEVDHKKLKLSCSYILHGWWGGHHEQSSKHISPYIAWLIEIKFQYCSLDHEGAICVLHEKRLSAIVRPDLHVQNWR